MKATLGWLIVIALVGLFIWWMFTSIEANCAAKGGTAIFTGSGLSNICVDEDGRILR